MLCLVFLIAVLAAPGPPAVADGVLRVSPADSFSRVSERLARDPSIREVVLAAGTYRGAWTIPPPEPKGTEAQPLLIRPADGAVVVFDGARTLPDAKPVRDRPAVFSVTLAPGGWKEPPRIWEPDARVRYLLAADAGAVERFPGSYVMVGRTILFHTSDSLPPGKRRFLASGEDFGIEVRRPNVTVRGLVFRNFVQRAKWSAGVQIRADRVTVERCEVANASFGWTILADDGVLVDNVTRDVGGGVYVAGRGARVERNRFFKQRDRFVVPTYFQDDTAIEAYYPAETGIVRGNLSVGFENGILIKSERTPWTVEENTVVGGRIGIVTTDWHPENIVRKNVIADTDIPVQIGAPTPWSGLSHNCYDGIKPPSRDGWSEPGAVTGEPRFVDPRAEDFRLGEGSACLAVAGGPPIGAGEGIAGAGANGVARPASVAVQAGGAGDAGRTWHVSPGGRNGADGGPDAPVRTIQYAVDRARPGDTILLHPGLYDDPVRFARGGVEGRPITLRATEKWKAVLDGARRHAVLIELESAPFVVIQDVEIRWFRVSGIHLRGSPDVRVEGCRIWNAHWGGNWPQGNGVLAERSPRFTATRNVIFRMENGLYLLSSPGARIERNTAVANLYGAVIFIRSIAGSTCVNNSFAYQGNDAFVIEEDEGARDRLGDFRSDYNNFGVTLSPASAESPPQTLVPRDIDRHMAIDSKAILYYAEKPNPARRFRSLQEWRDFSSLDAHSIFADPLFVDSLHDDFRLDKGSPNRGAGEGGSDIGAL